MTDFFYQKLTDLRSRLMDTKLIILMMKHSDLKTRCGLIHTMISHSIRLLALGNERKAYRFYAYALLLSKTIVFPSPTSSFPTTETSL